MAALPANAQNLNDVFRLDTSVAIKAIKQFAHPGHFVKSCLHEQSLYFTYAPKPTESIDLHSLHLVSRRQQKTKINLNPVKHLLDARAYLHGISIDATYLVLNFSEIIVVYERKPGNRFNYLQHYLSAGQGYTYAQLTDNAQVMLGACYYFNTPGADQNTVLACYDIRTNTIIKNIQPPFAGIGFSYFKPNNWIAASGRHIFFGNTTTYKVNVYDRELNHQSTISPRIKEWKQMPDSVMNALHALNADAGTIMNVLSDYDSEKISRLDELWSLNDSTLLVKYFEPGLQKYFRNHYADVYRLTDTGWALLRSRLADGNRQQPGYLGYDTTVPVTKNNWSIMSYNYAHLFAGNYLIIFKSTAPVAQTGKRYPQIYRDEQRYYKKNAPLFGVFIFRYEE